ncbi:transcriptional regulator [Peribacillus asahii]|uniref:Transcriptional regulator n=1 Tax=Peribacillus asahii TaxID=228899 RepID=A0A398BB89_9BACI|nr:helix-turn-helix domain-containing protein [Peribacillus asahii]RID87087.1 transcriptional regulator [Peribacillus asahii]
MDLKEFGLFFAQAREESGYESQRQLAIASGVSNGTIARIEAGTQKPTPETLKKIAPFLKSVDYNDLLNGIGYTEEKATPNQNSKAPTLSQKDEKDIAKRLEQIRNEIEHTDGLSFDGEPMSEEAVESLMEAMEHIVRQTKRINKKYIPKKHREDNKE